MAEIKLLGEELDVGVLDEISKFSWGRARWTSNKLIAASPFRYDKTPSFFVNLDGPYAGAWADSGAYDSEYESGNLAKLLAFLRNETYEETCEYLIELYGVKEIVDGDYISLDNVSLLTQKDRTVLDESRYIKGCTEYLSRRGITERVQRFMGVGYDKQRKAVTMPWRHVDRKLANVKYRRVDEKTFWYERGATPVRTLVYGIDKVYKHNLTKVAVCEAEIDAMSWYVCGVPAIAVGGVSVSKTQIDLIRKSPIEELIIAKDNDQAGDKLTGTLREELRGYVRISEVHIPPVYKDANDAMVDGVDLSTCVGRTA